MGHSKEIVTVDVYADKTVLAYDALAETEEYFKSLLPDEEESYREDILNIVIDVSPYLPEKWDSDWARKQVSVKYQFEINNKIGIEIRFSISIPIIFLCSVLLYCHGIDTILMFSTLFP